MKYDAVIFDLFGTLVDNPAHLEDSVAEYRQVGRDVALAEYGESHNGDERQTHSDGGQRDQ